MNSIIRKENIQFSTERIKSANNEHDIWNGLKDVANPKKASAWKLKTGNTTTGDNTKPWLLYIRVPYNWLTVYPNREVRKQLLKSVHV